MLKLLLVFVGGGAGALARYGVGAASLRAFGPGWPWGTLIVNVVGGALMGLLVAALAFRGGPEQERWRLLLAVGVLGGFTTFSAFSLDVGLMLEKRLYGQAAGYALISVLLSVGALFTAMMLARRLLAR
jgi:CrcB protein